MIFKKRYNYILCHKKKDTRKPGNHLMTLRNDLASSCWFLVCTLCACVSTWYIVSKTNSGESDDHKVERLQNRPFLHSLKHDCWHCEEDQTTNQNRENGRNHTHRGRPDLPFLRRERERGRARARAREHYY